MALRLRNSLPESKFEEQEAEGKPTAPPDEQSGCWSDLDSDLNWESIGR